MAMIVVDGFGLDAERKTFECLRCGRVEKPIKPISFNPP
jgi:hypothetical protein